MRLGNHSAHNEGLRRCVHGLPNLHMCPKAHSRKHFQQSLRAPSRSHVSSGSFIEHSPGGPWAIGMRDLCPLQELSGRGTRLNVTSMQKCASSPKPTTQIDKAQDFGLSWGVCSRGRCQTCVGEAC